MSAGIPLGSPLIASAMLPLATAYGAVTAWEAPRVTSIVSSNVATPYRVFENRIVSERTMYGPGSRSASVVVVVTSRLNDEGPVMRMDAFAPVGKPLTVTTRPPVVGLGSVQPDASSPPISRARNRFICWVGGQRTGRSRFIPQALAIRSTFLQETAVPSVTGRGPVPPFRAPPGPRTHPLAGSPACSLRREPVARCCPRPPRAYQ